MSKVRDAKILSLDLVDSVNSIVKEHYGKNYKVSRTGEVYVDDEKQPFTRYCGTWHISGNTLKVEIVK